MAVFRPRSGRYHLYVAAGVSRGHIAAIIFRRLKELEGAISMSVVSWHMGDEGWTFDRSQGSTGDDVNGTSKLSEVYLLADPRYTGRVTVPVLWDKKRKTIVNNESSEIIRMFNSSFDAFTQRPHGLLSAGAARGDRPRQRAWFTRPSTTACTGRALPLSQEAYEEAFRALFKTLDELEQRLSKQRYLCRQYG